MAQEYCAQLLQTSICQYLRWRRARHVHDCRWAARYSWCRCDLYEGSTSGGRAVLYDSAHGLAKHTYLGTGCEHGRVDPACLRKHRVSL